MYQLSHIPRQDAIESDKIKRVRVGGGQQVCLKLVDNNAFLVW